MKDGRRAADSCAVDGISADCQPPAVPGTPVGWQQAPAPTRLGPKPASRTYLHWTAWADIGLPMPGPPSARTIR